MRFLAGTVLAVVVAAAAPARAQGGPAELYRRSYALETSGDYAGALAATDDIATKHGRNYLVHLRRGWLLYQLGRHAEAAQAYADAVAAEPKALEPKLGAMLPLMALRKWKEAEKHGNDALALAPGDFTAQSRLAWIHYVQGRYPEAEAAYRKTLALWPANVEMRAGLAWSLLKQTRLRDARAEFDRVLAVAPDHASAREGVALVP